MANDYRLYARTVPGSNRKHKSDFLWGVQLTAMAVLLLLCGAPVVDLFLRQAKLLQRIDELELTQKLLLELCTAKPTSDRSHLKTTPPEPNPLPFEVGNENREFFSLESGDEDSSAINSISHLHAANQRTKREANNNKNQRNKKNKRKSRNRKILAAHFRANVDTDILAREAAQGLEPTKGNIIQDGFSPRERIYNIWKPSKWSNTKLFKYNDTSGKVKVASAGIYLVYAQILFHSSHARKSFGIHINNEVKPFIESLSYTSLDHTSRRRRHAVDIDNSTTVNAHRRHKRTSFTKYSQCNTMAVAYLKKNDEIFLKSLEIVRTVVAEGYLTFWGLVKL